MLQLPPRQLSQLLKEAEDLRDPVLVHVQVEGIKSWTLTGFFSGGGGAPFFKFMVPGP